MWAMAMVVAPRSPGQPIRSCKLTNNSNSDSPVMTSGITRGAAIMPVNRVLPRNRPIRVKAKPARAPNAVAKVALIKAMRRLSSAASMICVFSSNAKYQRREKPPHTETMRESLNE